MKPSLAKKIIHQIKTDYDLISEKFDQTRQYNWPEISELISHYVKKNMTILDIGCGNGRLLENLPANISYTGLDISPSNIKIAKLNYPGQNFVIGTILKLPFPPENFDIVFVIASLHHVPSELYRLQAVTEIKRTLKPNGLLIMSNWNLFQSKYDKFINKDFCINQDLDQNDSFIPWKNSQGQTIAHRYYHAFTLPEIKNLLTPHLRIIENKQSKHNLVTVAVKDNN